MQTAGSHPHLLSSLAVSSPHPAGSTGGTTAQANAKAAGLSNAGHILNDNDRECAGLGLLGAHECVGMRMRHQGRQVDPVKQLDAA